MSEQQKPLGHEDVASVTPDHQETLTHLQEASANHADAERRAAERLCALQAAEKRIAALETELETERMRLAACGVVAMANTPESAARQRQMRPEYRSASLDDVERMVDEQMQLRRENNEAKERIAVLEAQLQAAEQRAEEAERKALEAACDVARELGYATGHADDAAGLLREVEEQAREREREACREDVAAVFRARGRCDG